MSALCMDMKAIDEAAKLVLEVTGDIARREVIGRVIDHHLSPAEEAWDKERAALQNEIFRLRRFHEESTNAAGHAQRAAMHAQSLLKDWRTHKRVEIVTALCSGPRAFARLEDAFAYADKILDIGGFPAVKP